MSPKDQVKEIFSFAPIVRTVAVFLVALTGYSFLAGRFTTEQQARMREMQAQIDILSTKGSDRLQVFGDENAKSHESIIASIHKLSVDIASMQSDIKWLVSSQARETAVASRAGP